MYTLPKYQEELKAFFAKYTLERVVAPSIITDLKNKSERHCRFCKDKRQNLRFDGESHLIPQFLGNEGLLSDFECDACNKYFARMENHFANSLGIIRTIWAFSKGGSIPVFPSPSGITAKKENFYGAKGVSISQPEGGNGFSYNVETGQFEVEFDKHSYTPMLVYKALLKLALSTIIESDVPDYERAFQFLMTNEKAKGWCQILSSELPHTIRVNEPACSLFRKREYNDLLPTHVFMLSFENMTYQFPMWYNIQDKAVGLYKGPVTPLFCPPTFKGSLDTAIDVIRERIDLSSSEKIVREKGKISWMSDPELMKGLIAFDPLTGESKDIKFDPKTIVRVHLTNENDSIAFPFLSQDNKNINDATHSDKS